MEKDEFLKRADFKELNHFFELSCVKEEVFTIREYRRKVIEKFDQVIGIMNGLLQPDVNLLELKDADALEAEDRDKIAEVLRAFSAVVKSHQLLEMDCVEQDEINFFSLSLKVYKEKMQDVKDILLKVKRHELMDSDLKDRVHYFG